MTAETIIRPADEKGHVRVLVGGRHQAEFWPTPRYAHPQAPKGTPEERAKAHAGSCARSIEKQQRERQRRRRSTPKPKPMAVVATSDAVMERKAIQYALWIAERDGKPIAPSALYGLRVRCEWTVVYAPHRTRNVRLWDGSLVEREIADRRIRLVKWGRDEPRYNKRKDGRQGAWTHDEFVVEIAVELPNWAFDPPPPVEIVDEPAEPLAALAA